MDLRDYLLFLTHTSSIEELWAAHTDKMASYGFDRLIYGLTRYRTETSLGDPEDFLVLTNHSPAYLDEFIGQGLYFNAPMTTWALQNEGAASWRMMAEKAQSGAFTEDEMRVVRFNLRHGVEAGYTISFGSASPRSKGGIALTGRCGFGQDEIDALWDEHGQDILLMNNVAHLKICSLPQKLPNRRLTKRQREALEWVGDGKTTQDIALLMGLTPATVEKHLRLARGALAVETTAQAVLKATMQNQMFVIEA